MGLAAKLAGALTAVSATALPLAVDVSAAGADESAANFRLFDHTFRTEGGTVTCRVFGSSDIGRESGDPTFDALSSTQASPLAGDQPPCDAQVFLEVTYTNVAGDVRHSRTTGQNFVDLFNDDVVTGYVATHSVAFFSCIENCTVTFQTRPK